MLYPYQKKFLEMLKSGQRVVVLWPREHGRTHAERQSYAAAQFLAQARAAQADMRKLEDEARAAGMIQTAPDMWESP